MFIELEELEPPLEETPGEFSLLEFLLVLLIFLAGDFDRIALFIFLTKLEGPFSKLLKLTPLIRTG